MLRLYSFHRGRMAVRHSETQDVASLRIYGSLPAVLLQIAKRFIEVSHYLRCFSQSQSDSSRSIIQSFNHSIINKREVPAGGVRSTERTAKPGGDRPFSAGAETGTPHGTVFLDSGPAMRKQRPDGPVLAADAPRSVRHLLPSPRTQTPRPCLDSLLYPTDCP